MSHSGYFARARALAIERANEAVAKSEAANQLSQAQLTSAETTKAGLLGELGKTRNTPLTYAEFQQKLDEGSPVAPGSIFDRQSRAVMQGREFPIAGTVSGDILNPSKAIQYYRDTPTFQYLSAAQRQLMEGSLYQKGELYDRMKTAIQGPILESSAALRRETDQALYRNQAAQGTARRSEATTALRLRVAEDIMRQRQQNLWQSSLALDQYVRQAANQQIAFNTAWVNNLAGLRDNFVNTFSRLQDYYRTVLPEQIALAQLSIDSAYKYSLLKARERALRKAKKNQWIKIAIGIATVATAGIGAIAKWAPNVIGGVLAAGSTLMGAFGDSGAAQLGREITSEMFSNSLQRTRTTPPAPVPDQQLEDIYIQPQAPPNIEFGPPSLDTDPDFLSRQRTYLAGGPSITSGIFGTRRPATFRNVSGGIREYVSPFVQGLLTS